MTSQHLGHRGIENPQCPGHQRFSFDGSLFFKLQANLLSSGIPGSRESISGIRDAEELRISGIWDTGESESPVSGTPRSCFLSVHCFCSNSNPLLQPLKQQSIKKQCEFTIYYTNAFGSCFKNFPYRSSPQFPAWTPGSSFKT